MFNNKELIFVDALLNKIKKESDISFYCKDVLDDALISWNNIEYILNDTYRINPEFVELIDIKTQCKIPIPLFTSTWSQISRHQPEFVFNKINQGHTLVILGSSKITQKINHICYMIEDILNDVSIDTHVYCGLKNSKSFKPHYDTADNVIIHQTGKCHWKIYKQMAADRDYQHNIDKKYLDLQFECEIGPGDFIYVPKHQYHECIPLEKRISLSFPIVSGKDSIDRNWYKINEC